MSCGFRDRLTSLIDCSEASCILLIWISQVFKAIGENATPIPMGFWTDSAWFCMHWLTFIMQTVGHNVAFISIKHERRRDGWGSVLAPQREYDHIGRG